MDSKRQNQIGELIKRNLAVVLQQQGTYIYGNAMVSVTSVKVTPDLAQAKIYVSIFNSNEKEAVLKKISNHTHILKQGLASRIKNHIRRIPNIFFFNDEMIDEMDKVNALFTNIKTMYPPSVQGEEEE